MKRRFGSDEGEFVFINENIMNEITKTEDVSTSQINYDLLAEKLLENLEEKDVKFKKRSLGLVIDGDIDNDNFVIYFFGIELMAKNGNATSISPVVILVGLILGLLGFIFFIFILWKLLMHFQIKKTNQH